MKNISKCKINYADFIHHSIHATLALSFLKNSIDIYNNVQIVARGRASVARQVMLIYARQPSLQLPFRGKTHFNLFLKMLKTLGKSTPEA